MAAIFAAEEQVGEAIAAYAQPSSQFAAVNLGRLKP